MKYFAYGSNMNPQKMKERNINYTERIPATLKGYTLRFNKIASRNPAEGFANIVLNVNGVVEGVLYDLPDTDIEILDKYEGFPNHYDRKKVRVLAAAGEEEALTYIARSDKTGEGLKPTKVYLNHLLAARDMLSEDYYERLLRYDALDS